MPRESLHLIERTLYAQLFLSKCCYCILLSYGLDRGSCRRTGI
jgi:hypothetical protein